MNILYYFNNDGTAMYNWQVYHIFDELEHHNVTITEFNPGRYDDAEKANADCLKMMQSGSFDLFMTDQNESILFPDTVQKIFNMGIPRVLIHFDNQMDPYRYINFSKYFDVVMLLNIDSNPIYKKYKCPCVFAPYAANPYFFRDLRGAPKHQICFVGTPYGTRCRPINALTEAGIAVDLYANYKNITAQQKIGAGMSVSDKLVAAHKMLQSPSGRKVFKSAILCKFRKHETLTTDANLLRIHPAVTLDEMNRIYSDYALSISMPEARNTGNLKNPVDIVHLRNFEIPMCAGLQITRYYAELSEFFEEDTEILFYRSKEELIEKVKFYTHPSHADLVEKMKSNARRRAEAEHTWYKRFQIVFKSIGVTI